MMVNTALPEDLVAMGHSTIYMMFCRADARQ